MYQISNADYTVADTFITAEDLSDVSVLSEDGIEALAEDEVVTATESKGATSGIPGTKKPLDGDEIAGVTLAGLGVVFSALVILVIVIFLFGKIFDVVNAAQKKKELAKAEKKAVKPSVPAKPAAPAPAKPAAPAVQAAAEDDDEVIAVISAVVAMMSAADGTVYKVRSVKPARTGMNGCTAWAMDGRRQNVMPF